MPKREEQTQRVTFEHPLPARMMAIDGTWRRSCTVRDVSDTGATLRVETSVEGLSLLVLSSTGLAYRRCELELLNGDELKVTFLRQKDEKKKAAAAKDPPDLMRLTPRRN